MTVTFKQKKNGKVQKFAGKIIAESKFDYTVMVKSDSGFGFDLFNVLKSVVIK